MKKKILTALLIAALIAPAVTAQAGDEILSWSASQLATSYEIQQSLDFGASWSMVTTRDTSACTAGKCSATVVLPSTGMVLVRFATKNAVGTTVRYSAGVWHCESCSPPDQARDVGVQ